jgi:hypothetical protein
MRFTLVYEGDLPPNGSRDEKWRIRKEFDSQLRRLWELPPLNQLDNYRDPNYKPKACYLGRSLNGIEFISPVSEKIATLVELDILMLSASIPPRIIVRGGDIDNRLKTLLDSLKAPANPQEVSLTADLPDDNRIYCLMDDDKLVTNLRVRVDRLLTAAAGQNRSLVIIDAKITAGEGLLNNLGVVV